MDNWWLQKYHKNQIDEITQLIKEQSNVINHGWVNKDILQRYWAQTQIWLYPCIFDETSCLTAFEAASSKTLIITSDLAALNETVGDRGIIIPGDPMNMTWHDTALRIVCDIFNGKINTEFLINRNYEWSMTKTYDKMINQLLRLI